MHDTPTDAQLQYHRGSRTLSSRSLFSIRISLQGVFLRFRYPDAVGIDEPRKDEQREDLCGVS